MIVDAIIYLRKSREDAIKEDSLENHRLELINLCNKKNWTYEVYEEVASASSLQNRTEFQKVLELVRTGQVKRLVVMALDRLSRDKLDSAYIESLLIKYNVQVVTPTKSYSFDNEADLMLSDFENMLARQEYRIIRKRMLLGKKLGAENGYWVVGEAPLGYKRNKETRLLELVPEEVKLYKYIVECYLSGKYSNHTLAYHLNELGYRGRRGALWDAGRLRNLMLNKCYLGKVKYDNVWYDGKHEALITLEDWNKVQQQLKGNRIVTPRSTQKSKKRLSGICKCGVCGDKTLTVIVDYNRGKNFIKCHYKDKLTGQRCGNRGVQEETIVKQLEVSILNQIDKLQEFINNNNDEYKIEQELSIKNKIDNIEKQLVKINNRIINSKEMAKEGLITLSELKDELNRSEENITTLEYEKSELIESINSLNKNIEQELVRYKDIFDKLQRVSTPEEYNDLVREIVNKITVKKIGNELEVDIKFI